MGKQRNLPQDSEEMSNAYRLSSEGRRMLGKCTALAFLTAAALFAQSNQGRITGTISDPAGAVVPSAPN